MSKPSNPKKFFTFRRILSIVTLILVIVVLFSARAQIVDAINYLKNTNLFLVLLLIPEQLFMYYCAGQMFFSYLHGTNTSTAKVSQWNLARISFELNFVNHAIPSGGVSGLGYITWRLKPFGATAGQTSFMYILRYFITIFANQFQTLLAIFALFFMQCVEPHSWWIIWFTSGLSLAIIVVLFTVIIIASNKKRIDWFANFATNLVNRFVNFISRKANKQLLSTTKVKKYFFDIHDALINAKRNKNIIAKPIIWGIIYSFLEVATYWCIASSMGHPEILPQIMVAEAVGSAIGAVVFTPGGVGGYEGSMIFVMSTLGVDIPLATAVVVATRVIVLVGTILSGYGFYQHAISTIKNPPQPESPHA